MQKILVVLLFVFCGALAFGQNPPQQEAPQAQAQQAQALTLSLSAFPELYQLQLRMDKSFYRVGETPTYEILNAPANGFIRWWSWKYDSVSGWFVSTGEIAAYYSQNTSGLRTDGEPSFYWQGQGKPWTCKDMGFLVKTIQVLGNGNGISNPTATTFFAVNPGTAPGTECFNGAVGK
ncbi:MAG: hypothetical protein NTX55_00125 [Candidatus Parcubacteria bacterium]|nr:hypothetical protein [Candidatus Parcubacteria bacterium]